MFRGKGDGMSSWPGVAKKVLEKLRTNKDRLLNKLLSVMLPDEDPTPNSSISGWEMLLFR